MIRRTVAAVAVLSAILFVGVAHARSYRNVRLTSCRDANGVRVLAVKTTRLHNVGMSGRVRGRPVMLFNPLVLARFRPITRVFWFYHECAHQVLGHTLGFRPISRERDADCWAIREMKRRGLLTAAKLRTIEADLHPLGGDGVLYLPGPRRAAYVGYCATGRYKPRRAPLRMVRRNDRPGTGYRPRVYRRGSERFARRHRYSPEGPIAPMAHRRHRYGPAGSGLAR
jgi:hypothetical protein